MMWTIVVFLIKWLKMSQPWLTMKLHLKIPCTKYVKWLTLILSYATAPYSTVCIKHKSVSPLLFEVIVHWQNVSCVSPPSEQDLYRDWDYEMLKQQNEWITAVMWADSIYIHIKETWKHAWA